MLVKHDVTFCRRLRTHLRSPICVPPPSLPLPPSPLRVSSLPYPPCSKPAVPPELELVETDDQITHEITLEDKLEPMVGCSAVV